MKRLWLVLLIVTSAALPALSSSNLLNLGYNLQMSPGDDFTRRSVSLVYTFLGGEKSGFYAQLAPFFALSYKYGGIVTSYHDYGVLGGGLNLTLGYGHDFNFGSLGLILGGGFFVSPYVQYEPDYGYLYYNSAAGLGAGAHLYFRPGTGSFIINGGLDFAWTPFYLYGDTDWGFGDVSLLEKKFNLNLNVGIGFRH